METPLSERLKKPKHVQVPWFWHLDITQPRLTVLQHKNKYVCFLFVSWKLCRSTSQEKKLWVGGQLTRVRKKRGGTGTSTERKKHGTECDSESETAVGA